MKKIIQQILTDLECVQETFLGFSDDIWLNIEHNDSEAVQKGVDFKLAFNEKLNDFSRISSEISNLIETYTNVHAEPVDIVQKGSPEHERIIRELGSSETHRIEENFTSKHPYGFVFEGQPYIGIDTWQSLYKLFCKQLVARDLQTFEALVNSPNCVTSHRNVFFASNPNSFRKALEINHNIYAEGNLSANDICKRIKTLLIEFKVDSQELSIYLREDRNAME